MQSHNVFVDHRKSHFTLDVRGHVCIWYFASPPLSFYLFSYSVVSLCKNGQASNHQQEDGRESGWRKKNWVPRIELMLDILFMTYYEPLSCIYTFSCPHDASNDTTRLDESLYPLRSSLSQSHWNLQQNRLVYIVHVLNMSIQTARPPTRKLNLPTAEPNRTEMAAKSQRKRAKEATKWPFEWWWRWCWTTEKEMKEQRINENEIEFDFVVYVCVYVYRCIVRQWPTTSRRFQIVLGCVLLLER